MYVYAHYVCACVQPLSPVQLFVTPMDCTSPGSFVHGIFQGRKLEQVVISFSRDPPNLGIDPAPLAVSCTVRQSLYH